MNPPGKYHGTNDPNTNPCFKEAALSMKCLNNNHFVKEKCYEYFENYKACKKFWFDVKRKRRIAEIKPAMPDLKEREVIMQERRKGNIIFSAEMNQSKEKDC